MNAKLQNLFKLSSKITVYVPSTMNINEQIDNTKQVEKTALLLSNLFGGATACPVLGYWNSPTEGLVKEHTTMVYVYCSDKDLQEHAEKVVDYCLELKKEMKQDAIAVEINGEMGFI
jgi:hypothetical protein